MFIQQIVLIFTPSAWTGSSIWNYIIVGLVSSMLYNFHQGFTAGASYLTNMNLKDTSTFTQDSWLVYTIVELVVTIIQFGLYFPVGWIANGIENWWISVGGAQYGAIDAKAFKIASIISVLLPLYDTVYGAQAFLLF
ncbi:hypothetical protein FGO68_gene6387 [Halteria grandinella]|uniref:Uncharacterized protein n=1 Tax=Halteria grandinella TaxID=5974 RepID=A0A8J8NK42_HALGN|nr:hypothetical protein FGO68_gene6387 [Halteria grandinella]